MIWYFVIILILPLCVFEWASSCSPGQGVLVMLLMICSSWSWVRHTRLSWGFFFGALMISCAVLVLWETDLLADSTLSTLLALVFPGPLSTARVSRLAVVVSEVVFHVPGPFAWVFWGRSCGGSLGTFGGLFLGGFCWYELFLLLFTVLFAWNISKEMDLAKNVIQ